MCFSEDGVAVTLLAVVNYVYLLVFRLNKYFSGEALLGAGHSEMNKVQSLSSRNSKTSIKPCSAPVCGPITVTSY